MIGQIRQKQHQPRGIPDAAIEGDEQATRSLDPDHDRSLSQPGPGLSDAPRESNASAEKRDPDVERFHDGSSAAHPDAPDEWEVLEE